MRKFEMRFAPWLAIGLAWLVWPAFAIAADEVSFRLNWVPGTEHAYLYLGREKGWYAEAGINLEIIAGQGSTVAVKTVGSGETTFALADVASVARGWEADVPIVVAAVILKESPASIYSLSSKGIATIADACGKRIGINIKSTTTEQYRAMIRSAGLKDCKVEEVPISGGGGRDVLSGAVDAAVTYSYEDPLQIKTRGNTINEIIASQFFKLYSMSIITNKETATKHPGLVDRFLQVTLKSIRYSMEHPEEAKQAFLKRSPEADLAYENAKFDVFMKLMIADDPSGSLIGKSDPAGWRITLKTLYDLGIVKNVISPDGRFVTAVK
jgi:NitT/TauT family transport system substrate-binding protein